jgi:hypothetical protein
MIRGFLARAGSSRRTQQNKLRKSEPAWILAFSMASIAFPCAARAEEPSSARPAAASAHPSVENPAKPEASERFARPAFWTGARAGLFIPFGSLYSDTSLVTTAFEDVATTGPAIEIDGGARFARHFMGYAFFDHAFLGRGSNVAWTTPHGGQSAPSTQAIGIGLRWESNPDGWGIVADAGVAHRWLTARWGDGTTLNMRHLGEVRVGFGAAWRATHRLTIAPMMTVFSGAFGKRTLDDQPLGATASSYAAIVLTLSGHIDLD